MPRADKATFIREMLSELQLKQNGSAPSAPAPDSKEWWRAVAQGLGVEVTTERTRAESAESRLAAQAERIAALDSIVNDLIPTLVVLAHEEGQRVLAPALVASIQRAVTRLAELPTESALTGKAGQS